jgi:glycosyltransferase involved in cell wall biosynthesis
MAERPGIGVLFASHENWTGGTYYLLNLVHALAALPDDRQPSVVAFVGKPDDRRLLEDTGYGHLTFQPLVPAQGPAATRINRLSRRILSRALLPPRHPRNTVPAVFPYGLEDSVRDIPRKVCWIPDFQEHFHPEFFDPAMIAARTAHHRQLIRRRYPIVFSSRQAEADFHTIYPDAPNPTHVVRFATWHPPYAELELGALLAKHGVGAPYVITPNQFWKHKNHGVLLDAFRLLGGAPGLQLVLTGREHDFRHPDYPAQLRRMAAEYGLDRQVRFLGFIDRREQLQLMRNATAVIQPSLFEGWNTGIEDAKAMSQHIVASDIAVHREQLEGYPNAAFFSPRDPEALAAVLERLAATPPTRLPFAYGDRLRAFAEDLLAVLSPA